MIIWVNSQADDLCVVEDVADGKSSRPWAMHGKPPARPAGPSIEYVPIIPFLPPPVPFLKIEHWLIFKEKMGIRRRLALIPYFEKRSVVDFT